MSENEHAKDLREAGYGDAADFLEERAWREARAAAEAAPVTPLPGSPTPAGLRAAPDGVFDARAAADGESVLAQLAESGVGRAARVSIPLLGPKGRSER